MEYRESGPSVKQNIEELEDMIRNLQQELRSYKNLVENFRAETASMENRVTLGIEDTPKSVSPQIEEQLIDLQQEIKKQKDQNEHIQKQITALKKERSVMQQNVIGCNTRCQILDEHVGVSSS